MQMKGLRIKKILDLDVDYGRWKKNWKKRKEMVFEVVRTNGNITRKKEKKSRSKRKTRKR